MGNPYCLRAFAPPVASEVTTAEQPGQPAGRAEQVKRLMERATENYKDSLDLQFSEEGNSVSKGHSIVLEKGFVLALHGLWCDASSSPVAFDYDTPDGAERLAADCGRNRHGFEWNPRTQRFELAKSNSMAFVVAEKDRYGAVRGLEFSRLERGRRAGVGRPGRQENQSHCLQEPKNL